MYIMVISYNIPVMKITLKKEPLRNRSIKNGISFFSYNFVNNRFIFFKLDQIEHYIIPYTHVLLS